MLRSKTGNTIIEEMIMADWDVDGYMKLQFGNNKKGATYYIDNFSISREVAASLRMDENVIIIDHFNQRKSTNAIGGNTSVFLSENNSQLETGFSKETFSGKGHALQLTYKLPTTGSFAGYLSDLQNLDLREYQSLSLYINHNADSSNLLIGLKDHKGYESKVLSGHFLPSGSPNTWQKINIPLSAFPEELDLSGIEQLNLSFTHEMAGQGTILIDNISFEKILTGFLVDDFEREDKLNRMGKTHWTYADGAAAINGQHAHNSPNGIYRISYGGNIGTINAYAAGLKSFSGWATSLASVNCALCENLSFRIRGAEGNEDLTLYLDDGNFRWGTQLGKHVNVTTEWQEVTIPLNEFENYGVDTTHLSELQFMFEGYKMSGTIYVDDIRFWATPQ
ncbi:MAG: hypothetical protein GXP18_09760 [Gammaproteobacteria bacterium]|nr:hypothetical protein [Gammaproteobacteria bacterium]